MAKKDKKEPIDMVTAQAARKALDALELVFTKLEHINERLEKVEKEMDTTLEIRRLLVRKDITLDVANVLSMEVRRIAQGSVGTIPHLPGFPGTM